MPLIEVYSPPGTFDSASRDLLVAELTSIGMKCEKLPNVPFVQSVVWVYFHDTPMAQVYHAGKAGGDAVVAVVWNIFAGGFDTSAMKAALNETTAAVVKYGRVPSTPAPVMVLVREAPASNWAVSGEQGDLKALRKTTEDKPALL